MSKKEIIKKSNNEENINNNEPIKINIDSASIIGNNNTYTVQGNIDKISLGIENKWYNPQKEIIDGKSLTSPLTVAKDLSLGNVYTTYNVDDSVSKFINNSTIFEFKDPSKYLAANFPMEGISLNNGIIDTRIPAYYTGEYVSNQKHIEQLDVKNGVFSVNLQNEGKGLKMWDSQKHDDLFIVRDGIVAQSPTTRLLNESIKYIALSQSNTISLNESFYATSKVNDNIVEINNTSKIILGNTDWSKIGNAYNVDLLGKSVLQDNFLNISENYINLFSAEKNSFVFNTVPTSFSHLTSREYLNNSFLFQSTYRDDLQNIDYFEKENYDSNSLLIEYLNELKPDLKNLYSGAIEALNSNNSDKIRHYSSSLKELFTHIIHMLSPDLDIKKWSKDPAHFDKNRPTRRARLLYITRNINSKNFNDFIESDIKSTLEFINLFQEGTHSISPSFTNSQLKIMKTKMESTLIYLIEASKIN